MRGMTKQSLELLLSITLVVILVMFAIVYFIPGSRGIFEKGMEKFSLTTPEVPASSEAFYPGMAGCVVPEISSEDSAWLKLQKLIRNFDPACSRQEINDSMKLYSIFIINMSAGETFDPDLTLLQQNFTDWGSSERYFKLGGSTWSAVGPDYDVDPTTCWRDAYSEAAGSEPSISWLGSLSSRRGAILYKPMNTQNITVRLGWWQEIVGTVAYVRPLLVICGPIPDKIPPVLEISYSPTTNIYEYDTTVTLKAKAIDRDSGVKNLSVSIDGIFIASAEWPSPTTEQTIAPIWVATSVGSHTFYAEAYDFKGNKATNSTTITVIATPTSVAAPTYSSYSDAGGESCGKYLWGCAGWIAGCGDEADSSSSYSCGALDAKSCYNCYYDLECASGDKCKPGSAVVGDADPYCHWDRSCDDDKYDVPNRGGGTCLECPPPSDDVTTGFDESKYTVYCSSDVTKCCKP